MTTAQELSDLMDQREKLLRKTPEKEIKSLNIKHRFYAAALGISMSIPAIENFLTDNMTTSVMAVFGLISAGLVAKVYNSNEKKRHIENYEDEFYADFDKQLDDLDAKILETGKKLDDMSIEDIILEYHLSSNYSLNWSKKDATADSITNALKQTNYGISKNKNFRRSTFINQGLMLTLATAVTAYALISLGNGDLPLENKVGLSAITLVLTGVCKFVYEAAVKEGVDTNFKNALKVKGKLEDLNRQKQGLVKLYTKVAIEEDHKKNADTALTTATLKTLPAHADTMLDAINDNLEGDETPLSLDELPVEYEELMEIGQQSLKQDAVIRLTP